jgi:hypothetical protein
VVIANINALRFMASRDPFPRRERFREPEKPKSSYPSCWPRTLLAKVKQQRRALPEILKSGGPTFYGNREGKEDPFGAPSSCVQSWRSRAAVGQALRQLLSFALRALGATRAAPKQSLEKTALIMACVVGQIACCGVLFILSFYLKTGANKLVDLMVELRLPLGELLVNVVARISVPNEPRNFCKDLTICSKPGIAKFPGV